MTYQEALRILRKFGCAHATGDSLRAMYAEMIPWVLGLSKCTTDHFYLHFQETCESDSEIYAEGKRFITVPYAIFDVI